MDIVTVPFYTRAQREANTVKHSLQYKLASVAIVTVGYGYHSNIQTHTYIFAFAHMSIPSACTLPSTTPQRHTHTQTVLLNDSALLTLAPLGAHPSLKLLELLKPEYQLQRLQHCPSFALLFHFSFFTSLSSSSRSTRQIILTLHSPMNTYIPSYPRSLLSPLLFMTCMKGCSESWNKRSKFCEGKWRQLEFNFIK